MTIPLLRGLWLWKRRLQPILTVMPLNVMILYLLAIPRLQPGFQARSAYQRRMSQPCLSEFLACKTLPFLRWNCAVVLSAASCAQIVWNYSGAKKPFVVDQRGSIMVNHGQSPMGCHPGGLSQLELSWKLFKLKTPWHPASISLPHVRRYMRGLSNAHWSPDSPCLPHFSV